MYVRVSSTTVVDLSIVSNVRADNFSPGQTGADASTGAKDTFATLVPALFTSAVLQLATELSSASPFSFIAPFDAISTDVALPFGLLGFCSIDITSFECICAASAGDMYNLINDKYGETWLQAADMTSQPTFPVGMA